ncbi:MAG: GNAT family N-acetyltransferase [Cyanobacteria bacterium P01_A01_bin.84]
MNNSIINVADFEKDFWKIKEIREVVFQEEQGVDSSLDFDGEDKVSEQLLAYLNGEAVGTARIRYFGDNIAKIERLAVLPIARGNGIGKQLMQKALEIIEKNENNNIKEVIIHAQEYIKGLHEQVGFEIDGETFEEAGINHVKMIKRIGL